jgi:hypothetical protein
MFSMQISRAITHKFQSVPKGKNRRYIEKGYKLGDKIRFPKVVIDNNINNYALQKSYKKNRNEKRFLRNSITKNAGCCRDKKKAYRKKALEFQLTKNAVRCRSNQIHCRSIRSN